MRRSVNCLCVHSFFMTQPKKSCCNFFLQNLIHCFYSLTFKWFHHLKTKSKYPFLLYNDQNRHKQFAKSTKINHKVLVHVGISAGEVLGVGSWVLSVGSWVLVFGVGCWMLKRLSCPCIMSPTRVLQYANI